MEKEVLRLFKSYLGQKTETFSKEGLKYGLLIPDTANKLVIKEAIEQYGKDGQKWNQTFHKSFKVVKETPIEDLVMQQLVHYITTYGFESLGFYNSDFVYLPKEKLEIPELVAENIELITIKPITEEELVEKIMLLLTSGVALSKQTIKDVMVLSDYIDKNRFDEIVNKEIRTTLYSKYNIMPKKPEEFLRYLIFETTGETLKINNEKLITTIKERANKEDTLSMLQSYVFREKGWENLASIFLRNKNLFLAFKGETRINKIINKLRKLANKYHKPLNKNVLDNLTSKNIEIDLTKLPDMLDKVTIFREVRILNGVLYRLNGSNSIVYKIRNGKSYAKNLNEKTLEFTRSLSKISETIYNHLTKRLSEKVANKTIYIPSNVSYKVPTSEKQFSGNIPNGSYLKIPKTDNLIYGVHWKNLSSERVDLDLKQMNKSEVFGWDGLYRDNKGSISFSGDVTDAPLPNGATELFSVDKEYKFGAFLITLNNYTRNSTDVPFEFVVAKSNNSKTHIKENYVLDPNNILEKIDMVVKENEFQKVVGFMAIDNENIRFYFNDFSQGSGRTSAQDLKSMITFDYLRSYSHTQLDLRALLIDSGAKIVDEKVIDNKVENQVIDYNLSLNNISKETIIELLS